MTGDIDVNTSGATGDATLVNATAIDFAASSVGGNLTTTADTGNITDSGLITVGGTASFTTGNANDDIDLGTLAVMGDIDVNTSGATGDATLVNATAIDFATASVGGNLTATADTGNITNSGLITVGGTASFTTSNANDDIDLGTLAVTGDIDVNTSGATGHATLVNASAIDFAASSVGGNLMATATTGNLTDSGEINVTGSAAFIVADGSDISLNTAGNTFGGSVTIAASTGTINDGTLVGDTTLALGALTVSGDLNVTANGTLAINGAVTSTGGDIRLVGTGNVTQAANITAAGSAKVFADSGTITMASDTVTKAGANDSVYNRAIVYTATGDVTIATLEATASNLKVEVTSETGDVLGAASTLNDVNITGSSGVTNTTANIHALAANKDIGKSPLPFRFKNSAISTINYGLDGGTLYHSGEGGHQLAIPPITLAEHIAFSYELSSGLRGVGLGGGSLVDVPGLILSGSSGAAAAAGDALMNIDAALLKKRIKIYNIIGQGILLPKHQLDEEGEVEEVEEGGLTYLFQSLPSTLEGSLLIFPDPSEGQEDQPLDELKTLRLGFNF